MATETPSISVNGNYPAHSGYDLADQNYTSQVANTAIPGSTDYGAPSAAAAAASSGHGGNSDIPKDEVGWYFVEQYYTNLSKSPEKLFLFYQKQSQFVSGNEAEKAPVCVGQKAINDRIKELDFQDCKVRVTNVDSQGSRNNIVIQVIGEISNKSAPHRKFTQTFVLAEQTNGYFVLNDIFRYIVDEEEEYQDVETAGAAGYQEQETEPSPQELPSTDDIATREKAVEKVDQGLVEAAQEQQAVPAETVANGTEASASKDFAPTEDSAAETVESSITSTTQAPELVKTEDVVQPEEPVDPKPTPALSPPKPAAAQPEAAPVPKPAPAMPKTWANLAAAANRSAVPSAPSSQAASTPNSAISLSKPTQSGPVQPLVTPAPYTQEESSSAPQTPDSEWQAVAHDHGKRQTRPQSGTTSTENSRAYIKHVSENIDNQALRNALAKVAEVSYVDINRLKNCAFVDFASPSAYQAAVAANPHDVAGEQIYVEERRIRTQGYPAGGFAPGRSGTGRGRGGPDNRTAGSNRGGLQKDSARGGYVQRGRGSNGNGNTRGRGVQSAA